jgi:hypothetical protein
MKSFVLIIIFCAVTFYESYSQNKIIRTSGDVIDCKIDKEDSSMVYFTFTREGKEIKTFLNKSQVKEIIYQINVCTDPVVYKTGSGSYIYYQNGVKLNKDELSKVLKTNQKAYGEYESSVNHNIFSLFLACSGGAILGCCVGAYISGNEPNFVLTLVGGGMVFISLPIAYRAEYKMNHAVDIFNSGMTSSSLKPELRIGFSGNGIGFQYSF